MTKTYVNNDLNYNQQHLDPNKLPKTETTSGGGSSSPTGVPANSIYATGNALLEAIAPLVYQLSESTSIKTIGKMPTNGDKKIINLIASSLKSKISTDINYMKAMYYRGLNGDQSAMQSLPGIYKELDESKTRMLSIQLGIEKLGDPRASNMEKRNFMTTIGNYYTDIYGTQKAQAFTSSLASLAQIGNLAYTMGISGLSGGSSSSGSGNKTEEEDELTRNINFKSAATEQLRNQLDALKSASTSGDNSEGNNQIVADLRGQVADTQATLNQFTNKVYDLMPPSLYGSNKTTNSNPYSR